MTKIISIEGAEKITAEFIQAENSITYYLFWDSGKENVQKTLLLILVSLSSVGVYFFKNFLLKTLLSLTIILSIFFLIKLYIKLFKNTQENFQKEKLFLTEKNIIIQHALQNKEVKYIPKEKFKRIETKKTLFGDFHYLVYLDSEGISEIKEPIYFLKNISELRRLLS